ncbi:MAG: hypothetical protein H0V66_05200 [Bdellovibrionales bacterium]|nr:hypothetical protein [Bdellovibrionales bacterium]
MKTLLVLVMFVPAVVFANGPIEHSDESELIDEPVIPGTKVPLEKLNTAPTKPPIAPESKESRFILKNGTPQEKQAQESPEMFDQEVEDISDPAKTE